MDELSREQGDAARIPASSLNVLLIELARSCCAPMGRDGSSCSRTDCWHARPMMTTLTTQPLRLRVCSAFFHPHVGALLAAHGIDLFVWLAHVLVAKSAGLRDVLDRMLPIALRGLLCRTGAHTHLGMSV